MNPLVNPGAITATSMVTGATTDDEWKKIVGFHNDAAGRLLLVLQDVYKSEFDWNQQWDRQNSGVRFAREDRASLRTAGRNAGDSPPLTH